MHRIFFSGENIVFDSNVVSGDKIVSKYFMGRNGYFIVLIMLNGIKRIISFQEE
jgi:hypothetical protein